MDAGKVAKKWGLRRARCAAVIVAAGGSSRMGGVDKLMADLGGKPVLLRTLRVFQDCGEIDEIVVVTRQERLVAVDSLCRANDLDKVTAIVAGGETRVESVLAGLESISKKMRLAAIHDGARPLVTERIVTDAVRKARLTGAAAPAVAVKDTIKQAEKGVITATPDRAGLAAVQTPQVFDADLLLGALYKVLEDEAEVTDDCAAVERLGMKVHLTEGSDENIKITTPRDLKLANLIFGERNP